MKKSPVPLSKHTLNLFEGDMERLMAIAGTKIGAARLIRELVRAYLVQHEAKFQAAARPLPGNLL